MGEKNILVTDKVRKTELQEGRRVMANYEVEFKEYAEKLKSQIGGISEILNLNTNGLLNVDAVDKLRSLRDKAQKLSEKLEKNEFEVSIVGLEKAGKSSFANALIGNDILPYKEERCTYTSTSICYGDNRATVVFYSNEEFAKDFQEKLKKMGIASPEIYTYEQLSLENYEKMFDELDENIKAIYSGTLNKDIKNILKYKDTLVQCVGRPKKQFSGPELEQDKFKGFIQDPQYAIAVKEITIYSDKLSNMQNIVIYDVPGFDSPTQMHKEQTLKKMQVADAIILIAAADDPSVKGPLVDIFRREVDNDGIPFGDKMFVFANKADRAQDDLEYNMGVLRRELTEHRIMKEQYTGERVVMGSAQARLEKDGKAAQNLVTKGITDGIDQIINKLEEYNKTDRFEVMKKRVNQLQIEIRDVFKEDFDQTVPVMLDSKAEISALVTKYLDESRQKIIGQIESFRDAFKKENAPENHILTDKLRSEVVDKMTLDNFQVTDEELDRARSHNGSISLAEDCGQIDQDIRREKYPVMYNTFSDCVVNVATAKHEQCDADLEAIIKEGLGISEENPYYEELQQEIKKFIFHQKNMADNKGYYKSLVERFTVDLFEVLLKCPYGEMSRWVRYAKSKANFYSLAMYSEDFDSQLLPDQQVVLYSILLHSKKEKQNLDSIRKIAEVIKSSLEVVVNPEMMKLIRIIVKVEGNRAIDIIQALVKSASADKEQYLMTKLKNTVDNYVDEHKVVSEEPLTMDVYEKYFNGKRNRTSEDVRREIDADIEILREILNDAVVNAICIETPFLALEIQIMNNVINCVNGEEYRKFLVRNISKICVQEYTDLDANEQKNIAYKRMLEEIKRILDAMKVGSSDK